MRIKTINSIVEEIKQIDGFSAINLGMLRMLFETKALKSIQRGNRTVSDMDQLIEELNQLWGIEEKYKVPRIRSIHNAFLKLREIQPQLGLSEERIRFLVSQKKLPCVKVGNRAYVALECFEPPYDQNLIYDDYQDSEAALIEKILEQEIEKMHNKAKQKEAKARIL